MVRVLLRFICYDIPVACFLGFFVANLIVVGFITVKGIRGIIEG